ncbi:MAG: Asp-tRNA(Asn)/Glu-tRNA(Gln) amidotransferase GatCAB subunit A [Dehalococcoidia bacterium]|nr:Asp-tRNA(Asn)/Glu-tRNA(Gln) amidotransferase GatCAB subunit A [Dehalococcoidia bacterium]
MTANGNDLAWLTITEACSLVARRLVSPVELTRAVLDQIDRLEPTLNCFITRLDDQALAAAETAEAALASGGEVGPLHGIPIAVKDNIETAEIRSTAGSKILAGYVPREDAPAWARLKAAGAIMLGKTNLHEFGFGTTTINPHYGSTRNPWNPDHVPGGSSGGSAAAVSAGMAMGALGTDAGGSVRIPGALCGVVGLKQTQGRVPIRGAMRGGNPTRDHIGPITRTVGDAALLLAVMSGHDPRDPTSRDVAAPPETLSAETNLRGLRVGVPLDYYFAFVDAPVEAAVRTAIGHLGELGAEVHEVRLPDHDILMDGLDAIRAEALVDHEHWLRTRLEDYGEETQVRLLALQFILANDHAKALRARRLLLERYAAVWREVDLLAAPTVAVPAPTIAAAQSSAVMVNRKPYSAGTLSQLTRPSNYTGLPAISVPCGFVDELPVGLMLVGRPFDEQTLFRAANAYEQTTTWHQQRPPLSTVSPSA